MSFNAQKNCYKRTIVAAKISIHDPNFWAKCIIDAIVCTQNTKTYRYQNMYITYNIHIFSSINKPIHIVSPLETRFSG